MNGMDKYNLFSWQNLIQFAKFYALGKNVLSCIWNKFLARRKMCEIDLIRLFQSVSRIYAVILFNYAIFTLVFIGIPQTNRKINVELIYWILFSFAKYDTDCTGKKETSGKFVNNSW